MQITLINSSGSTVSGKTDLSLIRKNDPFIGLLASLHRHDFSKTKFIFEKICSFPEWVVHLIVRVYRRIMVSKTQHLTHNPTAGRIAPNLAPEILRVRELEGEILRRKKIQSSLEDYINSHEELRSLLAEKYQTHAQYIAKFDPPPLPPGDQKDLSYLQLVLQRKLLEQEYRLTELRYFITHIPDLKACFEKYNVESLDTLQKAAIDLILNGGV